MITPSDQLLKEVRGELVRRGTSLKAFCDQHGYVRQAVSAALSGKRAGQKSRCLAERFIEALDASK
ncbi:MAG: hypothetical protein IOC96_03945 [Rhodobacter sp.]|nr:hypothetical protein [Rhodobacter sp.]